jgi:hypothetical protein
MARPPKDPRDRKDVDLRIPVTANQKEKVMEAARLDQLDMAEWARAILLRAANQRIKKEDGREA